MFSRSKKVAWSSWCLCPDRRGGHLVSLSGGVRPSDVWSGGLTSGPEKYLLAARGYLRVPCVFQYFPSAPVVVMRRGDIS